jgi:thymidylate kinase
VFYVKIVAMEGIQTKDTEKYAVILTNQLKAKGYKVETTTFDRNNALQNDICHHTYFKQPLKDIASIQFLIAADIQNKQAQLEEWESNGVDYVVINRYTLWQEAYAAVNGFDTHFVNVLQKYIRQPDYEVLLDVPSTQLQTYQDESHRKALEDMKAYYLRESKSINNATWKEGNVKIIDVSEDEAKIEEEIFQFVVHDE